MNGRRVALLVAAFGIALVLAQDLYPSTPLYHTWQYALALAIALVVIVAYANGARRGEDGAAGKRLVAAMAGAAVVALAGLASGLLGPDTATIVGTPGTVAPLPALGGAAFFNGADAAALANGSAGVTVRRRGAAPIELADSQHVVAGESLLSLQPRPAAYVDAFDARGAHLTVTQPTNASFLSPILLFRDRQKIAGLDLPFDTFATPARHRVVRALYITADQLARVGHGQAAGGSGPALILTVSDDAGKSLGILLSASGRTVAVGGIHVRATLGTYPALAVGAAPVTWALVAGIALFLAGIVWSALAPRAPPTVAAARRPQRT